MSYIDENLILGDINNRTKTTSHSIINVSEVHFPDSYNYPLSLNLPEASNIRNWNLALNKLIQLRRENKIVYIHCFEGVSNSPSIVLAYLILEKGYDIISAYNYLKTKRPLVNINKKYLKYCQDRVSCVTSYQTNINM
jgi:protein-tyrosine phosphatase